MKKLFVFMVASFFVVSSLLVTNSQVAYAQGGIAPNPCDKVEEIQPGCNPPTLQQAEFLVGQAIAAIYGLTSVIFIGAFIYNGFIYMLGYFPEAKYWFAGATIENASEKMVQWVIALIVVLISYPLVSTLITFLIPPGSTCYENLRVPGFTFFFPDACTNGDEPPVVTPAPTAAPGVTTTVGPTAAATVACNANEEFALNQTCSFRPSSVLQTYTDPNTNVRYEFICDGASLRPNSCKKTP